MKRCSLVLLVNLLLSSFAWAQVTTSGLSGRITDAKNESLIGATVQALYTPTGARYATITDAEGRYRINNMTAGGPYEITFSYVSFKNAVRSGVTLQLGETTNLNVILEDAKATLSEVVVKGNRGGEREGAGINVGSETIRRLPTISRSLTDMTRLTPQVNNQNSFAGTNFRYNNVTIDGAINNDAIGFSPSLGGSTGTSGQPGSSTRTNPVSLDAIQDIQVAVAPFDVRLGNFLGGSVNAVTRSGTNKVTGSVYGFGRNATLTGTWNGASGTKEKLPSTFHEYQTGVRVGLPLIKDKLFFFTNEEITNRQDPVQFQAGSPSSLIKDAAVAQQLSDFVKANYGLDAGSYDNYSIYSKSTKFFNRLDWNINARNQLSIRNNTVFSEATNLERDAANFRFGSIDFRQNNNQSSTVAELKTQLGGRASNSLIAGYSTVHDYRTTLSNVRTFPQVEIGYNGGTIFLGNDREASVFNMRQKTFELTDNFTFYKGINTFTIGTHNEFYTIDYGFVNSPNGRISYRSVDEFLSKLPNRVRGSYPFGDASNNLDNQFNNPYAHFNVNLLSLYAQDDIQLTDRIKLSPGVRFDYTGLPNKPALSPQVNASAGDPNYGTTYTYTPLNQITNTYLNNVQVSPRLGFTVDAKGDRSLVFRGGAGLFTGRIPFAWLGYAFYNNGVGYGAYDFNNNATATTKLVGDPLIPNGALAINNNAANGGVRRTQVDLIDNNFKMPQMFRGNLAVDYTLAGYKITLEGLYTKVIKDLKFQQVNTKDAVRYYSYDTQQQQPIYVSATGTAGAQRIDNNFANAYLLSNTNQGYRYNLTAQIQKNYTAGFGFSAAYTYGKAYDLTNGIRNSMESNWQLNQSLSPNNPTLAYSNFDIRHRIVGTINYRQTWSKSNATTVTLFYSFQSGSPFSWGYVNSTVDGTGQANSLAYIPKDMSEAQRLLPTGTQAQDFMAFVQSDKYLSSRMGTFTERNGGRTPWNNTMDLRFLHEIRMQNGHSLQFSYDILNFLNLVDKKLGYYYFSPNTFNSTASIGLARATNPATGDPTFTWSRPSAPYSIDPLGSRWQMQLGARYSF
ncbi:carboxypeptidase regulatory-like domain-containing protein [Spirosoma sp. RP8]|uniref:Carboxypeptidase regulatory-like domain-containing protein n=1 Tax=Spirosoma liriopis TaxID=2937440 RepID=A0ABT0HSJ0_9BACT|nr:carboxypeptidase regulatory-like domain-containing protein [Spirosoma liriopis]MCK8494950.1 carboxypeptidase regulatory-like domain-containing protein [Spirosoma liriopis]